MWCDLDIRKRWQWAGRVFELDVQWQTAHRRVLLMGSSGIGKTMVLRAIAGLLAPDAGRIAIDGQVYFDPALGVNLPIRQRKAGYLFQDLALFPHLSVLDNVLFGLRPGLWWRPTRAHRELALQWLDRLQVAHLARHRPHMLSGGQQQRVALARLAVLQPRVLLLDEPLSALDTPLRQHLRTEILALASGLNVPLLMISHDAQDEAAFDAQVVRLATLNGKTRVQA
ncbi:hypothetical protein CCO03_02460 [Comamonas serinivorans]|uniref:ABC transporter domain-containing protein n=1 Tax=Comamonas serinivorans TaxID=1082851 RepID=A0A1Y0ESD9_9BURK|nr:hypothetical protein CCO03_02460 [Comamonas serinivorans]